MPPRERNLNREVGMERLARFCAEHPLGDVLDAGIVDRFTLAGTPTSADQQQQGGNFSMFHITPRRERPCGPEPKMSRIAAFTPNRRYLISRPVRRFGEHNNWLVS